MEVLGLLLEEEVPTEGQEDDGHEASQGREPEEKLNEPDNAHEDDEDSF